ncbi:MAG: tetratricopeptide repeat protein [Silvanigrellaceae bacterium]
MFQGNRSLFLTSIVAVGLMAGCASTPPSSESASSSEPAESPASKNGKSKAAASEKTSPAAPAAAKPTGQQSSVSFAITTLANEETFAGQIPQPKLEDVLRELEQAVRERNDDGGALISYLVFRRMSGASRDFLSVLEKRGSTASSRDPWILIECAYTALLRRDFGMVQYLLDTADAVGKGKDKVAAAVLHARGVMFYIEKKTVLAMAAFREAAKQNYEPSALTLALLAIRTGDHEGALGQLNRLKDSASRNLNVKAALGIAYRQAGKAEEALEYLRAVQKAKPGDKRLLWNVALAMGSIPARRKEAIGLLEKYNEAPGSNFEIDTRARNFLSKLQSQEEAARAEAAKAKAPAPAAGEKSASSTQATPPAGGTGATGNE